MKYLVWIIITLSLCSCSKWDPPVRGAGYRFFIVIMDEQGNDLLDVESPKRVNSISLRYDDDLPVCSAVSNLGMERNATLHMYWEDSKMPEESRHFVTVYTLYENVIDFTERYQISDIYPYNQYNALLVRDNNHENKNKEAVYTFNIEEYDGTVTTDSIRIKYFYYKAESGKSYRLAEKVYLNNEQKWDFYTDGAFAGESGIKMEDALKEAPCIILVK